MAREQLGLKTPQRDDSGAGRADMAVEIRENVRQTIGCIQPRKASLEWCRMKTHAATGAAASQVEGGARRDRPLRIALVSSDKTTEAAVRQAIAVGSGRWAFDIHPTPQSALRIMRRMPPTFISASSRAKSPPMEPPKHSTSPVSDERPRGSSYSRWEAQQGSVSRSLSDLGWAAQPAGEARELKTRVGTLVRRRKILSQCVEQILGIATLPDVVLIDAASAPIILKDASASGRRPTGFAPRGVSASTVVRKLKARLPNAAIIVLGEDCGTGDVLMALMGGASGYLVKPFSAKDLVRVIKSAAQGLPAFCREVELAVLKGLHLAGATRDSQNLSDREHDVAACLIERLSDKEIAHRLQISPQTVHVHLVHLFRKAHVHCREQLIRKLFSDPCESKSIV